MIENFTIIMSDKSQQKEEIDVLSSIYQDNEFSYNKGDILQCYYNVFPTSKHGVFKLLNTYRNDNIETSSTTCFVKYLPPVRIYLEFANDYPSKNPPKFYIIASWLSPWQISLVCQKLDEIWLNNEGQEILYLWFEFLRNDLLCFLRIENTLDISFMYMVYYELNNYFQLNVICGNDDRAICSVPFLNPISFLKSYDKNQQRIEFEKSYYLCVICYQTYSGKKCIQLEDCKCSYCRNCIQEYISIKIKDGIVNNITCPTSDCLGIITVNEIKELVSRNLFLKYDELLLDRTLKTMPNVIICPKISCQCRMIKETDDTLVTCSNCSYAFCSYCKKVYHGVAPCFMLSTDIVKLIKDYQNGDKHTKQLLEKEYGRKQIQIIVEKQLTTDYLKKTAKACPNCQVMIIKADGCNKMTCVYCRASFCWICGIHITTYNAYQHFLSKATKCYRRLFDEIS